MLQEIYATLRRNKMRSILTGLSISWGIFILIVLLGAGNGLQNGMLSNFNRRILNTVQLYSGTRSIPYKGKGIDQSLDFTNKQIEDIKERFPETKLHSGILRKYTNLSFQSRSGSFEMKGVSPGYGQIWKLKTEEKGSRFINDLDIEYQRKVIVIDKRVEEILFKEKSGLGNYILVGDIPFQVVGINNTSDQWSENKDVYIPFSTFEVLFNKNKTFQDILFTVEGLDTKEANDQFTDQLKKLMAASLEFDQSDENAIWIRNRQQDYLETIQIFKWIDFFVTFIGILTLIAGVVGVSNIMLVSVKERKREIGIRKAIGASSSSILVSFMIESILLTTFFGYLGMILGMGLIELISLILGSGTSGDEMTIFKDPSVKLSYMIMATVILVTAGTIAGYIPARKATKIKPIEAMKEK